MPQMVYNLSCNDLLFDVASFLLTISISYSKGRYFFIHPMGETQNYSKAPILLRQMEINSIQLPNLGLTLRGKGAEKQRFYGDLMAIQWFGGPKLWYVKVR